MNAVANYILHAKQVLLTILMPVASRYSAVV